MRSLNAILMLGAFLLLTGCVYHQPFEQGNILTPTKTQAIHKGMTSEEVIAKLGSPVLENMYANNQMIYVYTKQPTRHTTEITRFIVQFQNDRVVNIATDLPKIPKI